MATTNKEIKLNAVQISGRDRIFISPELDSYAFMNSRLYASLMKHPMNEGLKDDLYCYVKVSYKDNKPIYLKYRAIPNACKDQVFLSYINLCRLGALSNEEKESRIIKSDEGVLTLPIELKIEKTNWFVFNWNRGDSGERKMFRWAFIGCILALGSLITDLIFSILR